MDTFHLHISGQVQGVGFRPYVHHLACLHHITGQVSNGSDGVHVLFNAESDPEFFVKALLSTPPDQSKIERYTFEKIPFKRFSQFKIVPSEEGLKNEVRIAPDFGLCDDCLADLDDPSDRRFQYPFMTCTQCGPRYSIMKGLPYDRPYTTMDTFPMCPECKEEYTDPENRRFYSQTNSCPDCPVTTTLHVNGRQVITDPERCVARTVRALNEGKVVAVKGVGGYLLLCDATNRSVIRKLRKRKLRPDKPFAVMYPTVDQVQKDFQVTSYERVALTSAVAPIVLLKSKPEQSDLQWEVIAPRLDRMGVMLPYAPLFYLILKQFGKPVVATSGNVSGSPIVYQDPDAQKKLYQFADIILSHNREIMIPQDDSVVHFCGDQRTILRRSRGMAPSYFGTLPPEFPVTSLALGAEMKGAFALSANNQLYISQYLGALHSLDAQEMYAAILTHLTALTGAQSEAVFTDMHPDYFVRGFAKKSNSPIHYIQHHEAHFGAVLLENNLLNTDEKVLGVVWDGLGYGSDGKMWGSEFFVLDQYHLSRVAHLKYYPHLLGDKMSREPRLSALALYSQTGGFPVEVREKFTRQELTCYLHVLSRNQVKTSSMGRLFDAVASMLNLADRTTYEGQASMYLEVLARKSAGDCEPYEVQLGGEEIHFTSMLRGVLRDVRTGINPADIAYRFHLTLVEIIRKVAEDQEINHIAFSGGVFQNGFLIELIKKKFKPGHYLYFHKELSPNDENIPVGQLACGYLHQQSTKSFQEVSKVSCYEVSD